MISTDPEEFYNKKAVFDACIKAGVSVPKEISDYLEKQITNTLINQSIKSNFNSLNIVMTTTNKEFSKMIVCIDFNINGKEYKFIDKISLEALIGVTNLKDEIKHHFSKYLADILFGESYANKNYSNSCPSF